MNQPPVKGRIIAVVLLAGVLPGLVSLAAHLLLGDAQRVQEPLHEWFELAGGCIALAVAMLLLLRAQHEKVSQHLFWVVASLIAMGLVDGLHGIHGISLRSWQRHGATLMGGVLMGLVWLPLPQAVTRRKGLFAFIVAGLAVALGLWWGSESMPVTWDPVGLYTFPVIAANTLGGAGFLAAALFFCRRYLRQPQLEDFMFASLAVVFGMSSLSFGFAHTWAADWWAWHGFRLLAYGILLVAAYDTVVTLYARISRHAQELEGRVHERTAELAKANAALRQSKDELQRLLESMSTAFALFESVFADDGRFVSFRFVYINEAYERVTGVKNDDVRGKAVHEVWPKTEPEWIKRYGEVAVTGVSQTLDMYHEPTGKHYHCNVYRPGDSQDRFCVVFEDSTEREQVEQALRASEARFRQLAESLPQLVWTCRGDGPCDYLSPQWLEYTDIPEAEQLGFGWLSQLHPDDRDRTVTAWNAAVEANKPFDVEFRIRRKDGIYRWFTTRAVAVRDGEGRIVKWYGTSTDVEDQKEAKEALKTSEERFRTAAESLMDVVYDWDIKEKVDWYGDIDGLMGYPPGGFPRTLAGWAATVHPEDKDRVMVALGGHLKGVAPYVVEYRVGRRDGEWRWWSARGTALRDDRGDPYRMIGSITDISDRRLAEDALREGEARYRSIFEDVPVSIWEEDWGGLLSIVERLRGSGVVDFGRYFDEHPEVVAEALREVKILDVNAETVRMFRGRDKEDFLASLETVFATPDTMPGFVGELVALAEGKRVHETEMRLCTVHKDIVHVLLKMTFPPPGAASKTVFVSLMNITDRKRSEDTLRENEERFRAIFDRSTVGKSLTSPEGKLLSVNAAFAGLMGLAIGELQQLNFASVTHPDDIAESRECVRSLLAKERVSYRMEKRYRHKDGHYVWTDVSTTLLRDSQDMPLYFITSVLDISERKRAEQEVRNLTAELEQRVRDRTAQLEASNRELEAFSYSVSHDLRAPLRHVQGYVDMLAREAGDQLSENGRRYMKTIANASREMGVLIDDLLAFSRMGREDMFEVSINLGELVQGALRDLEPATRERNIVWKIPPLPAVQADPAMLKLALANLLGNAVKFTRPRDPAQIEIGSTGTEDGRVILFVRDNGVGFDPQYAHKLFGVFQRLHRADEFEGTGIGLANVRRIIARHGGRTWAEGVLDRGATFYFTLKPSASASPAN